MNGAHDLDGMHGLGEIDRSCETHFPHEWERQVFGLTLACGMLGKWNLDQSRFARENVDPEHYLQSSYYEHWLHGLECLLVEKGLILDQELASGRSEARTQLNSVSAKNIQRMLSKGGPTQMETNSAPRFSVGDRVVVKNFNPKSHTRAPRYIRGQSGIVHDHYGAHVFPDDHAANGEKVAVHLYSVRFDAKDLWGSGDAEPNSAVFVDVFESYLMD